MANRVVVTLAEDNTPVWETDLIPSHCASTPDNGPRLNPGVVSSTVDATETSRHVSGSSSPAPYQDSVPDYSDISDVETAPSVTPNGPRGLPKQLAEALVKAEEVKAGQDPLEVQIAKLVRLPPAPPGLVPRSLPQSHPLSAIQQQFLNEQLAREQRAREQPQSAVKPATSGLQQVLDNLQQNYPERQGYSVPVAIPPPIVRHDPSTAPSVLVPLSAICEHCGAVNLLVKDPITKQTNNNNSAPQ
jgi:hypothetical protein